MTQPRMVIKLLQAAAWQGNTLDPGQLTDEDISTANQYGLGPLLAWLMRSEHASLDIMLRKRLASIGAMSRFLTASIANAVVQLAVESGDSRKFMLLKGASLITDVYPVPHLRLMGDIDILVQEKDLAPVCAMLTKLGYEQYPDLPASFYENHHHLMPFRHPNSEVWIEVHSAIFPPGHPCATLPVFQADYFRRYHQPVMYQTHAFVRPMAELNLLYIITHWMLEFRVQDSAGQLLDIIYLMKKYGANFDWQIFAQMVDNRCTVACVTIVLEYLQGEQLVAIEPRQLTRLRGKKSACGWLGRRLVCRLIDGIFERRPLVHDYLGLNNVRIIWHALLCDRHPLHNYLSLLYKLLFPPERTDRFSLPFQWSRLRRLFTRSKVQS